MKIKIIVFVKAGNFRHSLLALLKTIPQVDLALNESSLLQKTSQLYEDTDLVIVDRDILKHDPISMLMNLKLSFPNAKFMLLEDRLWYTPFHFSAEVDCVVSKSTSTGDFLLIIKQLTSNSPALEGMQPLSSQHLRSSFETSVVS